MFWLGSGVAAALCSCGGTGAPVIQPRGEAAHGVTDGPAQPLTPQQVATVYAKLIATPGAPGVDYDPRQIMVVYKNGSLPALAAGLTPHSSRAAAMPNPVLRQNKAYETVTDAIAVKYGIAIKQQVYINDLNLASFDIPQGLAPAAILAQLRLDFAPQVAYALYSPRHKALYAPNDPDYAAGSFGVQWDCWRIRCGSAWDSTLGDSSVWIAVVDTGVRLSHQELTAQVINPAVELPSANCDVVNNDKVPEDTVGHGTFIAGLVAAQGNNGRAITGVAPHCRVLPVKISNDGYATSADSIAGWLLAKNLGAKVINYSFGGYNLVPAEEQAVNQIAAAGVLFVTAAGNEATSQDSYPAAFVNACAVGSTDFDDWCSVFSNWGTYIDVAAPGEGLKSTSYLGDSQYELDGAGTSFAAPLVAAAAGLLWSYKPALTLSEVRNAIEHHGGMAYNFALPLVRLDTKAALDSVVVPVIPAASGITVAAESVYGSVVLKPTLSAALVQPKDVVRAKYTLDLPPYNDGGAADVVAQSSTAPDFAAVLSVPTADNYVAQLHAEYFSSTDDAGTPIAAQVYVFNQLGDVNCDGAVDLLDLAAYSPLLGVAKGAPGYVPFFDSDLDGLITEADASAVGYFFNGVMPNPVVQSVTPTGGYTGEQVTFSATVSGQAPLIYAWDFGGGAMPNTSSATSPAVTLGVEGTYNASLTLSNLNGSDTFDFTLTVGPRPTPTAAFTATPSSGVPPLDVAFDASASTAPGGTIVNYQWSWDGDTIWEYESATPDAAHTFDALGDYTVRLRVMDDLAKTGEETASITVSDEPYASWNEYDLGLWGEGISNDNIWLTTEVYQGHTAILWCSQAATYVRDLHVAVAKNATPINLADWDIMTLLQEVNIRNTLGMSQNGTALAVSYCLDNSITYGELDGGTLNNHTVATSGGNFRYLDLAIIGGKPSIYFFCQLEGETSAEMHYAYATTAHPTSSSDWTIITITETAVSFDYPYTYNIELTEVDGLPFIQTQGVIAGNPQRVFAYADSLTPQASDWHYYGLGNRETTYSYSGTLFDTGALPQLQFSGAGDTNYNISYAIATVAQPKQAADWQTYEIFAALNWFAFDSNIVGGAPVVIGAHYLDPVEARFWIAQNASPVGPGDWLEYTIPATRITDVRRIVDHGGQPGLLAVIYDAGTKNWRLVYRYPVP
jgi:PKD repeat protein